MSEPFETSAEKCAERAESLSAFSGLKLLHIRHQIGTLLGMIGRGGIFDEYTLHDVSHVSEMLKILEWLIPETTKRVMSSADWLLAVLGIYFHDLGMLVTKKEYENRARSGFPEYRDKILFAGDEGTDYRARVEQLSGDSLDRFLYQEFVRENHANRISWWIQGQAAEHLGVSREVALGVDDLLRPLPEQFRRDLAIVCQSHHLDDLNNLKKYQTSQPYGNSDDETANLQYAAVLLRTTDLLHVTKSRTPSILFRTISPTDPLSQEEWAKQMAVTRVRPKLGRNKEGQPDEAAPRDTIEVYAYFKKENGFFGLTSYLTYVNGQLRKSYDWVQAAKTLQGAKHEFPWRYVDDTNIQTAGFIRETFEFTLDQARILDLLTGHTLYNSTTVVLRELVQNALDAVRVQRLLNKKDGGNEAGKVEIHWNSQQRMLTVRDNGTGMTQSIIESHLLKVGASRYQESQFKKEYPDFTPISRFGIGILTAFMIADSVDITTCHPDDAEARQLSLRSVHGRYLIRLLNKHTDEDAKRLGPHGTSVCLQLRPSAKLEDVVSTARAWIVIPGCDVTVAVDQNPPVRVGFQSPKEALAESLRFVGLTAVDDIEGPERGSIVIQERTVGCVTLAFAARWSEYYREWSLLPYQPPPHNPAPPLVGTCVEGIRVEFNTPGFLGPNIMALANATGPSAPKTNVARSGIEATMERDAMLRSLYSIYCEHVRNELEELHSKRLFSLTWATQESTYLMGPLVGGPFQGKVQPVNPDILAEVIEGLPILLIERDGRRQATSLSQLKSESGFWTVSGPFFESAESLIREVRSSASLSAVASVLQTPEFELPAGPILCGLRSSVWAREAVFSNREVDWIAARKGQRRIDLRWAPTLAPPRWFALSNEIIKRAPEIWNNVVQALANFGDHTGIVSLVVGRLPVKIDGLDDEVAVIEQGTAYLLSGSDFARYVVTQAEKEQETRLALLAVIAFSAMPLLRPRSRAVPVREAVRQLRGRLTTRMPGLGSQVEDTKLHELAELLEETNWKVFDDNAWTRRGPEDW
jgi:molecular chaperone HtpG